MPATGGAQLGIFVEFDKKKARATQNDIQGYIDGLQRLIAKDRLQLSVTVDPKKSETFLRAMKMSVSEIKKEMKDLEKEWDNMMKRGQVYDPHTMRMTKDAEALIQKYRELAIAREKVSVTLGEANKRVNKYLQEQAKNVDKLNNSYKRQHSYLENLIRRLVVYSSIGALGGFLTKIREVTAEFELQRISLGAIIQDQNRANQIFSQIKQFALKSPVKILDLSKYVKQVAAYRIETDKLFDTTKRLADVSVGLGVDMQRIVLAYGQVKAASYLRAAEIRQFTEAGIPLLELLSEKFTELKGRMVSTADVMEMVTKRGVDFAMVEEIFKDMTDAGGIFYKMQEKQGDTLFGMWAKLGDAASIMYDKIGNTDSVNKAMKGTINLITDLMRNWKAAGLTIASFGALAGGAMMFKKALSVGENLKSTSEAKVLRAIEIRREAEGRLTLAKKEGTIADIKAARAALNKAQADEKAALAAHENAQKQSKLALGLASIGKNLLIGLGIGAAIAAVTALIYEITKAITKSGELQKEVDKIGNETRNLQTQSVDNFKRLVDEFSHAAAGSERQKEILEELKRSYKDMLPQESLTIENLQKITSGSKEAAQGYKDLTDAIEAYIEMQQRQKQLDTVGEQIGQGVADMERKISDALKKESFMDTNEIDRFFEAFKSHASDANTTLKEKFVAAMEDAGIKSAEKIEKAWNKTISVYSDYMTRLKYLPTPFTDNEQQKVAASALNEIVGLYDQENKLIEEINSKMSVNLQLTIQQQEELKKFKESMHNTDNQSEEYKGTPVGENMAISADIARMVENMKAAMVDAKIVWDEGWANIINSNKPEEFVDKMSSINFDAIIAHLEKLPISTDKELQKNRQILINYIKEYQKLYGEIAPKDAHIAQIRLKLQQISNAMSDHGKNMRQYLMGINESTDAYLERLQSEIKVLTARATELRATIQNIMMTKGILGIFSKIAAQAELKQIEEMIAALKEMEKFVKPYVPAKEKKTKTPKERTPKAKPEKKPTASKKEDTSKQDLLESLKILEDIYAKYKELEKVEGPAKAAEHTKDAMEVVYNKANELFRKVAGKNQPLFAWPFSLDELGNEAERITIQLGKLTNTVIKQSDAYIKYRQKMVDVYNSGDIKGYNRMMLNLPKRWVVTKTPKSTDKEVAEVYRRLADLELKELQSFIQQRLKEISSEISQTKEAKNFFENILSATGDLDMAMSVTMSIYGETGDQLQSELRDQISAYFKNADVDVPIGIFLDSGMIDYLELEKKVRELRKDLGEETYQALLKVAQDGQKDWAKSYEGYLKDIEKAKSYSQKRIELARTTANEIEKIRRGEAGDLSVERQDYLIQGKLDKATQEAAKQEWEAFKDTPLYVQMFDDLEHASTGSLESMAALLKNLKNVWGESLDPQNLKEMESRLNEVGEQLARRNPFKSIKEGLKDISDLKNNGGYKSLKQIGNELAEATNELVEAQKKLDDALKGEQAAKSLEGVDPAFVKEAEEALHLYEMLDSELKELEKRYDEMRQQTVKRQVGDADVEWYNSGGVAMNNQIVALNEQMEPLIAKYSQIWELLKAASVLQRTSVSKAQQEVDLAQKRVKNLGKANEKWQNALKKIREAIKSLEDWQELFTNIASTLSEIKDLLGLAEDSAAGVAFDSAVSGLERMASIYGVIIALQTMFNKETLKNPWMAIAAAVLAVTSMLADWIANEKVRKANKEIEKQQKLIDALEYSYDRLQNAQEKLFGGDWIENYNQQLSELQMKANAYLAQMEAEKSKGKKADKDKMEDYKNSWRDTMDEIKDMRDDLTEYLAGTDLTSAARDWANSWLEARWSFEDTTEAMKEKFADMIQNMIVESMAAKIMESALSPVYNAIEELSKDGELSAQDIATIAQDGVRAMNQAGAAMEGWIAELEAAGVDLSGWFSEGSDLTGIARDIATASEESINGLAQGINTQNYYISHVPTISENVMAIRLLMEGGYQGAAMGEGADLMTLQNEHLAQLPVIAANTLATAERCERAALACEEMATNLERVIKFEGGEAKLKMAY